MKAKEDAMKSKPQFIKQVRRKASCDSISIRHQQFLMSQLGIVPIEDLGIIPETDRDNYKTEFTARRQIKKDDRIKPLNLMQRKTVDSIGGPQTTDRSRVGLLSLSHRSTANFPSGEYTSTEDMNIGALTSSRRRQADGERIDSPRDLPMSETQDNNRGTIDLQDSNKDIGYFDLNDPPKSRRRGNSMVILPQNAGLAEISESASNKENSRIEASELMTSPTIEASGVQQCLICFDKSPDAVFMDCGHGGNNRL